VTAIFRKGSRNARRRRESASRAGARSRSFLLEDHDLPTRRRRRRDQDRRSRGQPPGGRHGGLAVVPREVVPPGLLGGWVVLKPPVQGGHRMRLHANAALSLKQRERMASRVVEQGWSITRAAEAAEVSDRPCSKWVARFRVEGVAGLVDRSSVPRRVASRTDERTVQVIAALRRLVQRAADRRSARSAAVDRVGPAQAHRDGQAGAPWARGPPGATSARGRAS